MSRRKFRYLPYSSTWDLILEKYHIRKYYGIRYIDFSYVIFKNISLERQPAYESGDPGVTFRKLLEDVRLALNGAMFHRSVQISTYLYSPTTNSRSSHSLATQVDLDDRSFTLSPTGFYSNGCSRETLYYRM